MHRRILGFFLLIIVVFTFSQNGTRQGADKLFAEYITTEKNYIAANDLADNAGDDSLKTIVYENKYRKLLQSYTRLIPRLADARLDSAYITASVHCGILYHYFDSTEAALNYYLAAIRIKDHNPQLPDTLIFQPLIFVGSLFYSSDVYDSAITYLKRAEKIKDNYTSRLAEEHRLYNILGVIYYENGNLTQSLNYVQKALALHTENPQYEKALAANYKLNIASVLIKLEEYAEAEKILNRLVNNPDYPSEVMHKLGFIRLKQKRYTEALRYFDGASYSNSRKLAELYINKSMAFSATKDADSAWFYLLKAKAEAYRFGKNKRTITNGTVLKTEAELYAAGAEYEKALHSSQSAIINFCNSFSDSTVNKNPENFSGSYAYIDLFYALTSKGDILHNLYQQTKKKEDLQAALSAYKAAFLLAAYVEKTYDSDEARLFLNNIKYNSHSIPIALSLDLYRLTNEKKYLEEAYYFDQQNKASILALSLSENELKGHSPETVLLIKEAAAIKTAITRLSVKAMSATDSAAQAEMLHTIQDKEIALARIHEKIKKDPAWQQQNLRNQVPSVSGIQKKIDNSTAIISWHLSDADITGLIITRGTFNYISIPLTNTLLTDIESFKKSLQAIDGTGRYTGTAASKRIYTQLIQPLLPKLTGTERLIIIPDDELHYLPFEALQDEDNRFLTEHYAVQYLWSAALFQRSEKYSQNTGALSMAPYAAGGYTDSTGASFSKLTASGNEIGNIAGLVLLNKDATKRTFLAQANHYPVIHLATHATVNNEKPDQSFVAFSPVDTDYKLYAREIYNLQLDSVELLILSACETGTGQLIKGEGLMSLSRAFTYAGCSDIITSLWKAEDNTTAYITGKIHFYLAKGMTKDKALRQAKLDLLADKNVDPRFKSPNYWAHLIFIGSYETTSRSSSWPWIALAIILLAGVYYWRMKKNPTAAE